MDLFQLFIIWREIIHRQITLFGPKAFTDECVIWPKLIHRRNHYLAKIYSQVVLARVNTYMTNENKKLLIGLLEEFFSDYDINERSMLFNNDVAKCLKKNLLQKGRWKNLSRGKLIDGFKHKENLNKADKNECPF